MSTTRPLVPADPVLTAMPRMLDVAAMAPVLERSLGGGRSLEGLSIRYLRYKQARSLLVRYEAALGGAAVGVVAISEPEGRLAARAQKPVNLELAAKVADRTPAQRPLAYEDDPGVLVQWTPLDLALPAMAEPPERLREILQDAGVKTRVEGELPQLVHFKPNRRGVLRYGDHYVKVYADDRAYERAVAGMHAAAELPMRSARCEAAIPDLRLTAQSFVLGVPPVGPLEAAPAAGSLPGAPARHAERHGAADPAGPPAGVGDRLGPAAGLDRAEPRAAAGRAACAGSASSRRTTSRSCSRTATSTPARCSTSTATTG